jgi:hypothetical protein
MGQGGPTRICYMCSNFQPNSFLGELAGWLVYTLKQIKNHKKNLKN